MENDSILHPLDMFGMLGDCAPKLIRGRYGYSRGWEISKNGEKVVEVFESTGQPAHFVASGQSAQTIASTVRFSGRNNHRVSRLDSCFDIDEGPQFFEHMAKKLRRTFAHIEGGGAWSQKPNSAQADTLYLGSPKSPTRVRFYEKGKQDPSYPPNTVRVEVQYRPHTSRKAHAASLEPEQVFGVSRWSNQLFESFAGYQTVAAPPRPARVSSSNQKSREASMRQYGAPWLELFKELEGDFEALGVALFETITYVRDQE